MHFLGQARSRYLTRTNEYSNKKSPQTKNTLLANEASAAPFLIIWKRNGHFTQNQRDSLYVTFARSHE